MVGGIKLDMKPKTNEQGKETMKIKRLASFKRIRSKTLKVLKVAPEEYAAGGRCAEIAQARQVIMYLCIKSGYRNAYLAKYKFFMDHGTVCHGVKTITNRIDAYPKFAKLIERIIKKVNKPKKKKHVSKPLSLQDNGNSPRNAGAVVEENRAKA